MQPTLLILAAGVGSRYGGLKQVDGMGPGGEAILEYSVDQAIRAGFGKVVLSGSCFIRQLSDQAVLRQSKSKLGLSVASNATLIRPVHIE